MDPTELSNIVRLGRRIARPIAEQEDMDSWLEMRDADLPTRIMEARSAATSTSSDSSSTCAPNNNSGVCEKGTSSSTFTLAVVLGVVIPVVGACITFLILHRRHVRKQREEDADDRHASLDFGLGNVPQPGRKKKGPTLASNNMGMEEKGGRRERQMSMDLSMDSPYLLPPELQNSRESLHSLSRTIHQNEDPYRPVTQYYGSDGASVRSYGKPGREGSSIYTGSSKAPSRLHEVGTPAPPGLFIPPPRQNSLGPRTSHGSPIEKNPYETPVGDGPKNPFGSPIETIKEDSPSSPPYPAEPPKVLLPAPGLESPPSIARKGLPLSPRPQDGLTPAVAMPAGSDNRESYQSNGNAAIRASNNYLGALISSRDPSPTPPSPPKEVQRRSPPLGLNTLPSNPRPVRKESLATNQRASVDSDASDYGDGFKVTPPSPGREKVPEAIRGQRYSMDVAPEQFAQAGLGAPGFDPRRLSMGFRPLPPGEATESDDPEIRANRIRSFYKEYFDDSKPAPQGQYYEDYDENYLGDAAYYDPDSNAFVMPYAEPITRRAMTPPPRGPPRFQGPPRPRQGSMGAGPRGPPQMYPPGPYPQGPRAFSSASGGRRPPGPKKPFVPPAALTTLPTPSKLRDEDFAINNPLDFAPPTTARERVAGRSDSPFGERRPYSPAVPVFTPVISSFEELTPMPSPHLLRKSGTFTALDFAPPKRIRDPDSTSDAGSIRSNRSGVSAMHSNAIRNGAYRVSRIPNDVVFTKDDLQASLKPKWGLRAE